MTFVFVAAVFGSGYLLFLVQPLIAKQILPSFGGTASVWAVCLVFYQIALLAGTSTLTRSRASLGCGFRHWCIPLLFYSA